MDLPISDHKDMKTKAASLGITMADVFRELVARWIQGDILLEIETPQDKPRKTASTK